MTANEHMVSLGIMEISAIKWQQQLHSSVNVLQTNEWYTPKGEFTVRILHTNKAVNI